MHRLGGAIVRRARSILVGTLVFLALAGLLGTGVAEHLSTGGFDDPNSEGRSSE
jgi:hypothetical protein